jgi:hypothetical protein
MKPTAVSMTSSTATPVTCGTHFPTLLSSGLPVRPSNIRMPTPEPCSAITSASTTSSRQSKTAPRSRSITKAGSPNWNWTKKRSRRSTPNSTRSPKAKNWKRRKSSRPSGRRSKPLSARETHWSGCQRPVDHFEKRLEAMEGKAMIVACPAASAWTYTMPSSNSAPNGTPRMISWASSRS